MTNTFSYDAYGRLTEKVGIDDILFCYNGKYGVITEPNGLVYMRARYYSPELRRFINADVVAGEISNAITLNRYAYANGNPISNVDPLGLAADDKTNSERRIEYINSYMENTENLLYKLLEAWGVSLTKPFSDDDVVVDILWGGVTVTVYVNISFETPFDAPVNTDISLNSGKITHEISSPNLDLPWDEISAKVGTYVDEERLGVGYSISVQKDEWTYEYKNQLGLYSIVENLSISYQPEDEYLPTVTISADSEINHLVTLSLVGLVVAAVYATPAVIAAAPTAIEFIQQLGSYTPAFG